MQPFKGLEYRSTAVVGVNDRALPNPSATTPQELDRLQHEAALAAERCLLFDHGVGNLGRGPSFASAGCRLPGTW
ncbi:hypothetical protein [Streptomyces sp. NPDC018833]|uniref:hypothetical protein n=1 Tax=Streptomyces sp. NPDC018833 TaxID=3365053 RepID=UPI00378B1C73